ncbi:hypothetical protein HX780_15760 [Pseudomonas tolaasii]|uniref:hypothetical protein n=1 Tax=Pseudomonas tolaasii TaxID=29442 RepID=UPI0015A37E37|nr:hypothetical protein [Pseudomonas tolaasii]NVZ45811.1 hypothetical protein [Pseudomonas tolaasii]NWA49737.1 hypothetical protein [Pseudomonas tolaasii]
MKALAELSFEFIWHLMFTEEDYLELDFATRWLSSLGEYVNAMTEEEKAALAEVAKARQARWLAPPDKHGFSRRSQVTEEQKAFLEDLILGAFYAQFD